MPTLDELEAKFIKADDAGRAGDAQAAEDAAIFAAEIKRIRASLPPLRKEIPVLYDATAEVTPENAKRWSLRESLAPAANSGLPLVTNLAAAGRPIGDAIAAFANSPVMQRARETNPFMLPDESGGMMAQLPLAEQNRVNTNLLKTSADLAPIAGAVVFPPSAAGFAGMGGVGALSKLFSRAVEGKPLTSKEAMAEATGNAVLAGFPMAKVAPAAGFVKSFGQGVKGAAQNVGATVAAKTAEESIKRGELANYDDMAAEWRDTRLPAAVGFALATAGARLSGLAARRAEDAAARDELARLGITEPTPDMIRPETADLVTKMAVRNPAIAAQIGRADSAMVRQAIYNATDGGALVGDEAIGRQLAPYLEKLDASSNAYNAASESLTKAKAALAEAERATQLPPQQLIAIRQEAQANLLNAVQNKAAAAYEVMNNVGDMVSPSVKAREMGLVLRELMDARSVVRNNLYNRAWANATIEKGVPLNEGTALFPKDDILAVAEGVLGHQEPGKITDASREIMNAIRDAEAVKIPMILKGEREVFSKKQVDALKDVIAAKFPTAEVGTMSANEKLQSDVYHALQGHVHDILASIGPETRAAFDEARNFTRKTSQLQDSALGRAFLRKATAGPEGEVQNLADSVIDGVATQMAHGKVDELNNFKEFVSAVGSYSEPGRVGSREVKPDAVARLAMKTMADALRNAFMTKHTRDGGSTNWDAMLGDLLNAARYEKLPFPVENLGFGDIARIQAWRGALRQFKPTEINDQVVTGAIQNPEVRRVLENGGVDAASVLKGAIAEQVFGHIVQTQVLAEAAKQTASARRLASAAATFATEKGVDEATALRLYDEARKNPLYAAFEGRSKFDFAKEAQHGLGPVSRLMLETPQQYWGTLMNALREANPEVAELVERRLLADTVARFHGPNPLDPGGRMFNPAKIREFFDPVDIANAPVTRLRETLGAASVQKLEKFLTKVADLNDRIAHGRPPGASDGEEFAKIAGLSVLPVFGAGAARLNAPTRIMNVLLDAVRTRRYHIISSIVKDDNSAAATLVRALASGAPLALALSSMPAQKAILLTKDQPLMEEFQAMAEHP